MNSPKVSILIPCYNARQWVGQAIQSALDQTYPSKEVIVVDDGSTDGSLDVIKSFGDQIRWETGPNRGGNVARNRLLELSTGEWLQYLDADDYLLPDKVELQLSDSKLTNEVDMLFGVVTMETWSGGEMTGREVLAIPEPHDPWVLLARWFLPQTGAPLWRKDAVLDVGAWKPDQPCCQEHELYMRLLLAGKKFRYLPTNGAVYRQWSTETVCTKDVPEVHRRRMEITDRVEKHLCKTGQMTPNRQDAINIGRFETARGVWQYDHAYARQLFQRIRNTDRGFVPRGASAPPIYRMIHKLFGFAITETIADWRRALPREIGVL